MDSEGAGTGSPDLNPKDRSPDSKRPCFRDTADTQRVLTACGALCLPLFTPGPPNPHFIGLESGGRKPGQPRACSDGVWPQFPLRAAHSQHPQIMATPAPDRRLPTAQEPQRPQTPELRTLGPFGPAPNPPDSPHTAEPGPTDGCACAPQRRLVLPPTETPAQKEPAPPGFHSAQARQLSGLA